MTFNYTAVLENVYGITPGNIVHIHGSLRDYTHGQALRYSNFKQVNLPIISLDEQKQISDYLDMKTSQMDGLIQDISSQLALLKEYRQSVISEAVTGKVAIS